MTDAETQREVLKRVEGNVGDLSRKMDEMSTAVTELTTEVRMDREARSKADTAHDATHSNHEQRLSALETWRTVQETTVKVAPPALTWGRFWSDARSWWAVVIATGGVLFGIFK